MAFDGLKNIFHLGGEPSDKEDYDDEFDEFEDFDDFDDTDEGYEEKKSFRERLSSKVSKKQTEEYDDSFDDYSEPVKEPEKKKAKQTDIFGTKKTSESKVISMSKPTSASYSKSGNQIFMLKPKKIDDAKSAVDALLSNKIVILNLEGIALDLAQSVTDFISGASYCISGNFSTISQNVFVYTPNGVDLTGAFEDEFFGGNSRDY